MTLCERPLYVEFGGLTGDCGQYHGYVVDSSTPARARSVLPGPDSARRGIWGTSGAVVSPKGDLYVATGNGSSNQLADFDEGNAVVELSPSLHRLGYWAPSNWVQLNDDDWDLGSAGPISVPGTSLLFVAGKPAEHRRLRVSHEGGPPRRHRPRRLHRAGSVQGVEFSAPTPPTSSAPGKRARIYIYAPAGAGPRRSR